MGVSVVVLAACGTAAPQATGAPAAGSAPAAQSEQAATAALATADVESGLATTAALQAAATGTTAAGTAQAVAVMTSQAAQATASMANQLATGTAGAATRVARATSTAQPLADEVERLMAEGYLARGAGSYEGLLDFFREWAQINWYQWYATGKAPADFVVQADVAWKSASDKANWFNSGCGFVFRETPPEGTNQGLNHYLAYLGLDGVVYMSRQTNSQFLELGRARYGRVEVPEGGAHIMLAVEGDAFHFFVNGEHVLSTRDGALANGNLNYTLLSGTNRDFGTRCEMTHVGLWTLEP
jgi:hypothetical protein